ncbi:MAG: type II toxin-antitoxin system VapC family toxin [Verrucomicrobiae bacterium]|nr:type II toxin-antitoxin system VapC family toxin [Verrucomicrobiae bacterium]
MGFLLDTNIISEIRKPSCDAHVHAWVSSIDPDDCFISVLTAGEIRKGIDMIRVKDSQKARQLETWLTELLSFYADRVLDVDTPTALEWGRMAALGDTAAIDVLIAATARRYGLTVATRNLADFKDMDIMVFNPFEFQA